MCNLKGNKCDGYDVDTNLNSIMKTWFVQQWPVTILTVFPGGIWLPESTGKSRINAWNWIGIQKRWSRITCLLDALAMDVCAGERSTMHQWNSYCWFHLPNFIIDCNYQNTLTHSLSVATYWETIVDRKIIRDYSKKKLTEPIASVDTGIARET